MIPSPFVGVVLALAAYRLTRLVGWDDFPLALKLRTRLVGAYQVEYETPDGTGRSEWATRRPTVAKLLTCPFCIGWWLSVAAYLVWRFDPTVALYIAAPLALSAAVGLIAKNWDA